MSCNLLKSKRFLVGKKFLLTLCLGRVTFEIGFGGFGFVSGPTATLQAIAR
jgi:hypothetical protein